MKKNGKIFNTMQIATILMLFVLGVLGYFFYKPVIIWLTQWIDPVSMIVLIFGGMFMLTIMLAVINQSPKG